MLDTNIKEYEGIRKEMSELKDCITKYIGYVFAGSGALIYGMARVERTDKADLFTGGMTVITAGFSMLISLVLLIIFYKFHSHNRFAGFCKLLNHERHELLIEERRPLISEQDTDGNLTAKKGELSASTFSWEITVGALRGLESSPSRADSIIAKIEIIAPEKKKLLEEVKKRLAKEDTQQPGRSNIRGLWQLGKSLMEDKSPVVDEGKHFGGVKLLAKTLMLKNIRTDSWGFPPLVVCIFLFLAFGFLFASYFIGGKAGMFCENLWLLFFEAVVTIFQLYIWWNLSGNLYSLMHGSTTICSFFWKFVPSRTSFLNSRNIKPSYPISIECYVNPKANQDTLLGKKCPDPR